MISRAESKRLIKFVDQFPRTRTLVVGDVMLDHYVWGSVSRISPEAPVPVVSVTKENVLLGGASNVVNNIHSLGGGVSVCGVIGRDDAGRQLIHMLRNQDIPTGGLIVEENRSTSIKTRVIAHNQQVVRFDRETKNGIEKDTHLRIYDFVKNRNRDGLDASVLFDNSTGELTNGLARSLLQLARQRGVIVTRAAHDAH